MANVRTFTLPHYHAYPVHVAVFKDVRNASYLMSQLLAANPEFDYAFLDAEVILSAQHLYTTTFLALHAFLTHRHKTRTPHSELVFRLSPNNNIGEAYKKFGIGDTTHSLIAVKLALKSNPTAAVEDKTDWVVDEAVTNESVSKHLGHVVEGTSVVISEGGEELGEACDVDRVRKMYKLSDMGVAGKKGNMSGDSRRDEKKEMEAVILGIMALKGS